MCQSRVTSPKSCTPAVRGARYTSTSTLHLASSSQVHFSERSFDPERKRHPAKRSRSDVGAYDRSHALKEIQRFRPGWNRQVISFPESVLANARNQKNTTGNLFDDEAITRPWFQMVSRKKLRAQGDRGTEGRAKDLTLYGPF